MSGARNGPNLLDIIIWENMGVHVYMDMLVNIYMSFHFIRMVWLGQIQKYCDDWQTISDGMVNFKCIS